MDPVRLVKRLVGLTVRVVGLPLLVTALALGAVSGPRGVNASLSPKPQAILQELQTHHDLPKGTSLTLGDPQRPLVVTYDAKGRVLVTPPKGQTFGTIAARGFSSLSRIAKQAGIAIPDTRTAVAVAQSSPKRASQ